MDKSDVILDSRLTKVETKTESIAEDIKEIRVSLRWITGLVFSLNSAILGVVTKGFGIL